jgi:hypothetical protein
LLKPADNEDYLDGFSLKTVVGAFFVGLVMMPASIYLFLFQGGGLESAAQWVTIIIFVELARRSLKVLSKQEIYVLYYVAAGLAGGGAFAGLIWQQFLRQSREATEFGVSQAMPLWAAPGMDSPGMLLRQMWQHDWWQAIAVILAGQILIRLNWFGLGYVLFRLTSDVEKLPFPLASIASEGATALAETPDKNDSWRWRVFSVGSMIGLVFGMVYIGVPAVTGLIFNKPLQILAIPWLDFSPNLEGLLPASMVNLTFDIGQMFWGALLPYWMVVGQFVSSIATSVIANPILHKMGLLPTWKQGMGILSTQIATQFDFWLSVGIGVALSVAAIGIWHLIKTLMKRSQKKASERVSYAPPKGRGDIPIWISLALFIASTAGFVVICHVLVPKFPVSLLMAYGFIWTPVASYVSARMIGLTGNGVSFPYMKEGSFILSGYKGVDIWFAPIPLNDFGGVPMLFRQLELTKTKFTSIIKAELLMFPINLICSFLFWAFFWSLSAIPSHLYPFVDKIWPFQAINQSLFMTATMEGRSWLLEALRPSLMAVGLAGGLGLYWLVSLLKGSAFLFYGAAAGVASMPGNALLQLVGALLGKYYFSKKYGDEAWYRYVPVLSAGFACGAGLVAMLAVGITMVAGSILSKPF